MQTTVYDAYKFVLGNAESYDGELDCRIIYDNMMKTWMVECGQFSLVLPSQEIALQLIAELPKI